MNFDFHRALPLFRHTLLAPSPRGSAVGTDIAAGMLKLAHEALVSSVSLEVSNALAAGRRVWITSDLHFNHARIIGFCDRPFKDTEAMNSGIRKLLMKVGEDDLLIIAGDLKMGEEINPEALHGLPGRKILVVGNHDFTYGGKPRFRQMVETDRRPIFDHVVPFLFWQDGYGATARPVMVTHFPLDMPGSYDSSKVGQVRNYHGHLHDVTMESTEQVKYVNVCWDVNHGMHCL